MANSWNNGPLPGNEKKAEARRRQRANKPPKPNIFQLLSDSLDRGDDATAFLAIICIICGAGACITMFVMFLNAL